MALKHKLFEKPYVHTQTCQWGGCDQHGEFEAPKTRNDIHDYYYFCLNHVREYNAKWNFYEGMSTDEVERLNRQDTIWERPTWPFGTKPSQKSNGFKSQQGFYFEDPFDIFSDAFKEDGSKPAHATVPANIQQALARMKLSLPLTQDELKKTYKTLVKKLHPDIHKGDPKREEEFKLVSQAYHTLKTYLHL
jgi:curved DNA-binding protein CbpA